MANFDLPSNSPVVGADGMLTPQWLDYFSRIHNYITDDLDAGTTAQRPTVRLYYGRPYDDKTLGKPIWFSALPNIWRDATGAIV